MTSLESVDKTSTIKQKLQSKQYGMVDMEGNKTSAVWKYFKRVVKIPQKNIKPEIKNYNYMKKKMVHFF